MVRLFPFKRQWCCYLRQLNVKGAVKTSWVSYLQDLRKQAKKPGFLPDNEGLMQILSSETRFLRKS